MSAMRSQDGPQAASGPRPKINAASSLLTQDENDAVFKLLGKKCQVSDCTASASAGVINNWAMTEPKHLPRLWNKLDEALPAAQVSPMGYVRKWGFEEPMCVTLYRPAAVADGLFTPKLKATIILQIGCFISNIYLTGRSLYTI